eukprot:scaffold12674_cov123-Isochrysis_galbana.AAC.3
MNARTVSPRPASTAVPFNILTARHNEHRAPIRSEYALYNANRGGGTKRNLLPSIGPVRTGRPVTGTTFYVLPVA